MQLVLREALPGRRSQQTVPRGIRLSATTLYGDPYMGGYEGTLEFYNLMRGLRTWPAYPEGDPFIDPTTDEPTRFTVTGDPFAQTGWVDGMQFPAGNRRFWMSTGPFTLAREDTAEVVFAQVAALGTDNLSSLSQLLQNDRVAQLAYDQGMDAVLDADDAPTDVLPSSLTLRPGYPNPFRAATSITVDLDRPQRVRLAVYDLLGREVVLLHDGMLHTAGLHRFTFDGAGLTSGVYVVRAAGDRRVATQRIVLLK